MAKTIFEKTVPGSNSFRLPEEEFPGQQLAKTLPERFLRQQEPDLPEMSEVEGWVILVCDPLIGD